MVATRLRMGMIGGGPGAFIGAVHRIAAEMDREIERRVAFLAIANTPELQIPRRVFRLSVKSGACFPVKPE